MNKQMDKGILAFGAYVPRLRLQRASVARAHAWFNPGLMGLGKGERAMANWDEDPITMAVEAARDCLGDFNRDQVTSIGLSSTSLPNSDRLNSGIVKEALNLSDATGAFDICGSLRAGTSALIQALAAAAGGQTNLCIASEKRRAQPGSEAELSNGDAAAAVLVGPGEPIARCLGSASISMDFVDHFRAAEKEFDYHWESRWIRDQGFNKIIPDAIRKALHDVGMPAGNIDHLLVPLTGKGIAEGIAKKTGIKAEAVRDPLGSSLGYAGAAHPLLMLADTLKKAKPGERILLVGFGQGCDVILLEVTQANEKLPPRLGVGGWLARRKPEENYIKYLAFNELIDIDRGMRAEADFKQPMTALFRNRKAVLGLVGGRCTKTGTVQFPKTDIGVNPNDRSVGSQEDYPLADRSARIMTYTADNLTYTPDPPAHYGMIEFDGGGRMMAEFVDADAEDIEVGKPVRMMFRIKNIDERRGFKKYFWKATPIK